MRVEIAAAMMYEKLSAIEGGMFVFVNTQCALELGASHAREI